MIRRLLRLTVEPAPRPSGAVALLLRPVLQAGGGITKNCTISKVLCLWCLKVALFFLWLVMYVLAPLPVEHFAPFREYARVVDRTGILPGALYYTDVEQSLDAETNNRDAIRFWVNKPERADGP